MTTYRTTRPSGRLTKTERQVGKFKVQTYLESSEFGWIGYRVINADRQQVIEVLEGTDPEFDEAVEIGLELANTETIEMIQSWNKKLKPMTCACTRSA